MRRPSFLRVLLVVSLAGGSGCGLILDVAPADPDAATPSFDAGSTSRDAGPGSDAGTRLEDGGETCDRGTQCPLEDALGVCVDGECVASTCGDGVHDPRTEQCDDGNTMDDDGCPHDCQLECETTLDCPVEEGPCLGPVDCVDLRCEQPTLPDGTPCVSVGADPAECRAGRCAPLLCGNDSIDIGEQCDDANTIPGDGCEADCTFSCVADADCDDGLFCTGVESCERTGHTCVRELRGCPIGDVVCQSSRCDEAEDACMFSEIDFDLDGHLCATDCAPANVAIHPGATEICNAIDDDCDERIDEDATTAVMCFVDADGDGFGAIGSAITRCACLPDEVSVGGDCYDHPTDPDAPLVNPGVTAFRPESYTRLPMDVESFDWNCVNGEELLFTETSDFGGGFPACDAPSSGTCRPDPRWEGDSIPFCGDTGQIHRCVLELDRCVRTGGEAQVQRCR